MEPLVLVPLSQLRQVVREEMRAELGARWWGDIETAEYLGMSPRAWRDMYKNDQQLKDECGELREYEGGAQRWYWRREDVERRLKARSDARRAL